MIVFSFSLPGNFRIEGFTDGINGLIRIGSPFPKRLSWHGFEGYKEKDLHAGHYLK